MTRIFALMLITMLLGGCVWLGAAAWANHDYNYHCYGRHHPADWCRDHR